MCKKEVEMSVTLGIFSNTEQRRDIRDSFAFAVQQNDAWSSATLYGIAVCATNTGSLHESNEVKSTATDDKLAATFICSQWMYGCLLYTSDAADE